MTDDRTVRDRVEDRLSGEPAVLTVAVAVAVNVHVNDNGNWYARA